MARRSRWRQRSGSDRQPCAAPQRLLLGLRDRSARSRLCAAELRAQHWRSCVGGAETRLRWTAGLYFCRQTYDGGLDVGAPGMLPANFVGFLPSFYTAIARPWFVTSSSVPAFSGFERETESRAVFGALEFDSAHGRDRELLGESSQSSAIQTAPDSRPGRATSARTRAGVRARARDRRAHTAARGAASISRLVL